MKHPDDLDTVGRFRDRAADYVKYRPTYPAAAIDAILDRLGAPDRMLAADIGAGTGISARLLGDRRVRVVAVEPGEAMRRAADPHRQVAWVAAKQRPPGCAPRAPGSFSVPSRSTGSGPAMRSTSAPASFGRADVWRSCGIGAVPTTR
jgi:hypothetical protein